MRCKKHIPDLTSTVGVCASCLRERLQALLDAQLQSSSFIDHVVSDDNHHRRQKKPDLNPPPPQPTFPRSVSPYVTRRRDHQFHSTPQLDQAFPATCNGGAVSTKRKLGRLWILSNIFRSRSNKTDNSSRESYVPSSTTTATPPPSTWYSTILTPQQQNHAVNDRRKCRISDRGASPADNTPENFVNEIDGRNRSESGLSTEPSPQRIQQTTATTAARRSRLGPAGKSLTSLALCLSPLVRASPNRQWNSSHKGLAQELGVSGAHHISTATTFCSNRSRKLADFGRLAPNR